MKSTLPTDRFHPRGSSRAGTVLPPKWRFRRSRRATLIFAIVVCYAIYHFVKQAVDAYIAVELAPQTMGGIAPDYDPNQYRQRFRSQPTIRLPSKGAPPPGKPPSKGVVKSKTTELAAKATPTEYDGPVRFNNFYSTLQTIGYLGTYPKNQFILFYAENSRAASRLLGLACQFAIQGKTVVHFGIAGRNDDDPAQLIAANQLSADPKCELTIHDARSERAMDSTPSRNGIAIRAALGYFNRFMHPQAVIVDPENETSEFLESVRHKNQLLGQTTVELPRDAVQKLPWFQFLDSGSLQSWNNVKVEILIRADSHNGNLIRLLKSLKNADYLGNRPTRIIVQIPTTHQLNFMTQEYIRDFDWPSKEGFSLQLLLLDESDANQAAARIAETFYPKDDSTYLLILDPNVELSRSYYYYLFYTILHYRYPHRSPFTSDQLSSISLLPHPFVKQTSAKSFAPFLSTMPSSNATLIFPDHWKHFHTYTRELLKSEYAVNRKIPYEYPKGSKWLELFTQISYARGWQTLYPAFPDRLAILHEDSPSSPRKHAASQDIAELAPSGDGIMKLLPKGGELPEWSELVLKDWKNADSDFFKQSEEAEAYRRRVSGCGGDEPSDRESVADLFCPFTDKKDGTPPKEETAIKKEASNIKGNSAPPPPPKAKIEQSPTKAEEGTPKKQDTKTNGDGPRAGSGPKVEQMKKPAAGIVPPYPKTPSEPSLEKADGKSGEISALEEVVNWVK